MLCIVNKPHQDSSQVGALTGVDEEVEDDDEEEDENVLSISTNVEP